MTIRFSRYCWVMAVAVVMGGMSGQAATVTWSNGGGNGLWSNPANWGGALPAPGDDVVFNGTSVSNCTVDLATNQLGSLTVSAGYSGAVLFKAGSIQGGSSMTLAGNLTVNSGRLLFQGDTNSPSGSGFMIYAANVTVGSSGTISADGQGFANQAGPGAGMTNLYYGGGGGAYGGRGGSSSGGCRGGTNLYGSVATPMFLGSGGGDDTNYSVPNAGSGGGAIAIYANSGLVTVDGTLSVNGTSGTAGLQGGGGSGGSLWISCLQLAGSGTISADGGNGGSRGNWESGGGGGGGRLKVNYSTITFNGTFSVSGGAGGTGSTNSQAGFPGTFSFPDGGNVTVKRSFALAPGSYNIPTLVVQSNAILSCQGDCSVTSGVTISSSSVTIQKGGVLSADAQGFPPATGPGAGSVFDRDGGSGGSYGGYAGCSTGSVGGVAGGTNLYGSATEPVKLGSGGGIDTNIAFKTGSMGFGGGVLKLQAEAGQVTVEGTLSANGANGSIKRQGGGGSGGSLWIICDTLAGSGVISADGGNGGSHDGNNWSNGGGGGGGRVKIAYNTSSFTGTVSVAGGADGLGCTTPGTAGYPGTYSFPDGGDLTVARSFALAPGSYAIPNLVIRSNAILSCQADLTTSTGVSIASSSITIERGGVLCADGQGFPIAQGIGRGMNGSYYGGGGGTYGGIGGHAQDYRGGYGGTMAYGSSNAPVSLGSGGGADTHFANSICYGGGALHIASPAAVLTVNGRLSASGASGTYKHSTGGGSGGSLWVECKTLTGSGDISARGGDGGSTGGWGAGGGGGGGRISLNYIQWNYAGTTNVDGGTGPTNGLPGSIFMQALPAPGVVVSVN